MEAFRNRMYYFLILAFLMLIILIIQLINLQFIQGTEYLLKSRMNMENFIPITAQRGEIYDRNFQSEATNTVIATNRSSFNLTTIPARFANKKEFHNTINNLSKLLNITNDELISSINENGQWERVVIKEDVAFNVVVKIASHEKFFPNIKWEAVPTRVYNYGNMFSHIIGYIGSISRNEFRKLKRSGYKHYQKIGKTGIEKEYDVILRGVDGYIKRIVDVKNRVEGEEVGIHPVTGKTIVLTIDKEIQKTAYDAMENQKGSVIVVKPSTGEILALISKPDFDPNLILSKNNYEIIKKLTSNINKPFMNRAIQARYPPASTFKLITAITALEEEKWKPNWTIYCPGKYTLHGYKDRDIYCYKYHGTVDMYQAIAESCSVYFYHLGYKIGPTLIFKYAHYMGLGDKTGIDINGEIKGFIPSKNWKLKTFGQPWYDGDTINLSIGQGFIAVTVAGMANFLSGIVNNGVINKLHLVKEIRSHDNKKIISKITPEKLKEIPLAKLTLNSIKTGMRLAVTEGTSRRLKYIRVPIAGKTGTAQTRSKRKDDATQHAWFIGYAPYRGDIDKSIVVAVLVEYGIAGAVSATPVAEKIFAKLKSQGYF